MESWTDLNLNAGRLNLNLANGMLRYLRLDGFEVVRGLYFGLRDKNWNTIPEVVISVDSDIGENFFSIKAPGYGPASHRCCSGSPSGLSPAT